MASHEEYIELISAAVDGTLSETEAARLQSHLAQCADCRSLLRDMQDLHAALRSLPAPEPPADLTDRILANLAADNVTAFPAKRAAPWRRWAASAAVVALVLAGTWGLRERGGQSADLTAPANGVQAFSARGAVTGELSDDLSDGMEESQDDPEAPIPEPAPAQKSAVSALSSAEEEKAQAPDTLKSAPAEQPVQNTPVDSLSEGIAADALPTSEPEGERFAITSFRSVAPVAIAPEQGSAEVPDALPIEGVSRQAPSGDDAGPEEASLEEEVASPEEEAGPTAETEGTDCSVPSSLQLTARQALEKLIEAQGFTGYQWIEDGKSVSVRPELSRTPAILWMNGTEGISYINYLGLSEEGDYHLFQFDHLDWDIVEFNSCPTGQLTHLTRYSVPVTGEGEILVETLDPTQQ